MRAKSRYNRRVIFHEWVRQDHGNGVLYRALCKGVWERPGALQEQPKGVPFCKNCSKRLAVSASAHENAPTDGQTGWGVAGGIGD